MVEAATRHIDNIHVCGTKATVLAMLSSNFTSKLLVLPEPFPKKIYSIADCSGPCVVTSNLSIPAPAGSSRNTGARRRQGSARLPRNGGSCWTQGHQRRHRPAGSQRPSRRASEYEWPCTLYSATISYHFVIH